MGRRLILTKRRGTSHIGAKEYNCVTKCMTFDPSPFCVLWFFPSEEVEPVLLVGSADEGRIRGVLPEGRVVRHLHFLQVINDKIEPSFVL